MARTLEFIPLAPPVDDISVNHLPANLEILEFAGRVDKSPIIKAGAIGAQSQANLEFGIMAVADLGITQRIIPYRFTVIGPTMPVPTGAKRIPGLVPLPNGVPLYLFQLPD